MFGQIFGKAADTSKISKAKCAHKLFDIHKLEYDSP